MIVTSTYMLEVIAEMITTVYTQIFLLFVALDIASGLAKATLTQCLDSSTGIKGLVKHMLVVLLVLTVYPYMRILSLDTFATAFVLFYTVTYAISIIENLHELGIPFPTFIKDKLEKLKEKTESGKIK